MCKLWLLLAMVLTGIIYAVVLLYIMPMSQSNKLKSIYHFRIKMLVFIPYYLFFNKISSGIATFPIS